MKIRLELYLLNCFSYLSSVFDGIIVGEQSSCLFTCSS